MFTARHECPNCNTTVTDWSARCPKCRFHPDSDREYFNRAQHDVALIARYRTESKSQRARATATTNERQEWRRFLPTWLRRPSIA